MEQLAVSMAEKVEAELEALLDKIYEAAVHPDGWPLVLDEIGEVSDSAGGGA